MCLEWASVEISEALGRGEFVDSDNSDITFSRIHSALGEKAGLERSKEIIALFKIYQMLEEKDAKPIEE